MIQADVKVGEILTFQCENVLLRYKSNGQCLACIHPIRDALG